MKKTTQKPAATSPKARRSTQPSTPAPLLAVTLDARASALVRRWAEILHRSPEDVANGLLLDAGEQTLTQQEKDMDRAEQGQSPLYPENYLGVVESVAEAAMRSEKLLQSRWRRARGVPNPRHLQPFTVTISPENSSILASFAEASGIPAEDILEVIVADDLKSEMNDNFLLLSTIARAGALSRARR